MTGRSSALAGRDLVLTRTFDAPRSLVWDAWTVPEHLARWWGPHEYSAPRVDMDLRPGGALVIDMQGPDGTVRAVTGTIHEVTPPERLVVTTRLTYPDGSLFVEVRNTVTLTEVDGQTRLRFEAHVIFAAAEAAGPIAGMEEGWSQSLDKLASDVATRAAGPEMIVTRVIDAPRALVWDAWTDPVHISNWWGPEGFTTTTETMDVRPGGRWIHVMHDPVGTDYPNFTEYLEVVRPERLVYTNRGGEEEGPEAAFRATVTFDEEGGRTRVTMRAEFASAGAKAFVLKQFGAYEGAHQTLNRLARHLARASRT